MAILYKKSLSGIINHITMANRHLCGINITVNNISLVILSIYMPCDTVITQEILLITRFLIVWMILNVF